MKQKAEWKQVGTRIDPRCWRYEGFLYYTDTLVTVLTGDFAGQVGRITAMNQNENSERCYYVVMVVECRWLPESSIEPIAVADYNRVVKLRYHRS